MVTKLFNLIRGAPIAAMTMRSRQFRQVVDLHHLKRNRHEIATGAAGIDRQSFTIGEVAAYCYSRFEPLFDQLPGQFRKTVVFFVFSWVATAAKSHGSEAVETSS